MCAPRGDANSPILVNNTNRGIIAYTIRWFGSSGGFSEIKVLFPEMRAGPSRRSSQPDPTPRRRGPALFAPILRSQAFRNIDKVAVDGPAGDMNATRNIEVPGQADRQDTARIRIEPAHP